MVAEFKKPEKPQAPGEWSLAQIQSMLSREIPGQMLSTLTKGGAKLDYIPWHVANRILDKYAPGWTWQIISVETTGDRIFLVGRLSIPTCDGIISRDATGTECLKEMAYNKATQQQEWRELAYGDPSSNAESMAFRRAAARFGLGLYLYDK